jgi:hypothetical protein
MPDPAAQGTNGDATNEVAAGDMSNEDGQSGRFAIQKILWLDLATRYRERWLLQETT